MIISLYEGPGPALLYNASYDRCLVKSVVVPVAFSKKEKKAPGSTT
jgi:hypothetical protein